MITTIFNANEIPERNSELEAQFADSALFVCEGDVSGAHFYARGYQDADSVWWLHLGKYMPEEIVRSPFPADGGHYWDTDGNLFRRADQTYFMPMDKR